jgi:hypothetical protein
VSFTAPVTSAFYYARVTPGVALRTERVARAGGLFGLHPSITLVAAGPTPLSFVAFKLGGSSINRVVESIERASARSAAALISALLICRATRRGLYFAGGCSSFGPLLGMVADLSIGANSGTSPPMTRHFAESRPGGRVTAITRERVGGS